jgi:16S rRNA (guanine966-N2)-methyltransferase
MRIVAGRWRGRRLAVPGGSKVRPTADRVREAWMSILQPRLPGALVLDLFSGSGALGLEALSRGAARADLVEIAPQSLRTIRENVETLGARDVATIHRADALRFVAKLQEGAYDVVFADPPYALGLAARLAHRWIRNPFSSVLSIEHRFGEELPGDPDIRRYGDTAIAFYDADTPSVDTGPSEPEG